MSTESLNDLLSAYSLGLAIDLERDPPAIHGAHYIHLNCARLPTGGSIAQLNQMAKTRQKIELKKIVKLTDHTYACDSLTHFLI